MSTKTWHYFGKMSTEFWFFVHVAFDVVIQFNYTLLLTIDISPLIQWQQTQHQQNQGNQFHVQQHPHQLLHNHCKFKKTESVSVKSKLQWRCNSLTLCRANQSCIYSWVVKGWSKHCGDRSGRYGWPRNGFRWWLNSKYRKFSKRCW